VLFTLEFFKGFFIKVNDVSEAIIELPLADLIDKLYQVDTDEMSENKGICINLFNTHHPFFFDLL